MATKIMDRWLKELQQGTFMLSDIQRMDKLRLDEVVEHMRVTFPHRFLELNLTNYQEIGLAEAYRAGAVERGKKGKGSQTYHHCVFLTGDSGALTGLTFLTKLRCRQSPTKTGRFELWSGSGVSFFRDIDGWALKVLDEKTVSLTKDVLKKRGWFLGCA